MERKLGEKEKKIIKYVLQSRRSARKQKEKVLQTSSHELSILACVGAIHCCNLACYMGPFQLALGCGAIFERDLLFELKQLIHETQVWLNDNV